MLEDIRNTPQDRYWEELRRRWGALLSYRYIGKQFSSMNNVVENSITLRHDMRNAAGGVLAAPLAISCPVGGGGKSDLQAVPNPVIHSLQILDDARDVRRLSTVDATTLKDGRRFGYGRAKIVDADDPGRVIALVETQSTVIGDVPEGLQKFDDDPIEHVTDSPDLPPLWRVFGGSKRGDGHWVLPELKLELASPDAALHLGPQHVVLEAAAIDLAGQLVGTDRLQMLSWHVMHLARGKRGPFRVEGAASSGRNGSGRVGVQLTLHDEGDDDRPITGAAGVFHVVD